MQKRQRLCMEYDVVSILPTELWHEVFLRVGFFDLMVSLPCVSKTFKQMVGEDNDYLWYNLCKRVFGVEHIRLHSSLTAFFSRGWKEVFEARVKLLLRLSGADLAAIANFPRAHISEERIWEPQSYHLRLAVGLNDLPEMKEILNILKHRERYDAARMRFLNLLHTQEQYDILSNYAFFAGQGDGAVEKKHHCFDIMAQVGDRIEFLRRGAGVLKAGRRMSREGLLSPMEEEQVETTNNRGRGARRLNPARDLNAVQTCVFAIKTLDPKKDTLVVESSMAQGRIHLAFLDLQNARREVIINGETLNSLHLRNFTSSDVPSLTDALLERMGIDVSIVPAWLFYFFLVFVSCLGFSDSTTCHLDSLIGSSCTHQPRATMQNVLNFLNTRASA